MFKKILIANRGEIAVRIIKSAHQLGIDTVAIYSHADADSMAVRMATEAFLLEGNELNETYLNIDKIIYIAKTSKCDAIHPGYGFLAENTSFAKACLNAGIIFIGPHPEAIRLMGNKVEARNFVKQLGVPLTKAATGNKDELLKASLGIPLPILVKAAAGGGGKGMRIVHSRENLDAAIASTQREAEAYFGHAEVFIEQYIENPRHIEIQVLGDKYGNMIHLFERECSLQRRYQKIIEESPSPTLTPEVRKQMCQTALNIAQKVQYDNAGTIEFLVDKHLNYYFLEMNTRIQVEHPVTEMVTGIDLVKEQIHVAAGNRLSHTQNDIQQNGHAIEARVYAEDPFNDFRPSPGKISFLKQVPGKGIRIDTGIDHASTIHSFYDPMISKIIAYGQNREMARDLLLKALTETSVIGIQNNLIYLYSLLDSKAFKENLMSTNYCDEEGKSILEHSKALQDEISMDEVIIAYAMHDLSKKHTAPSSVWSMIGYWRLFSRLTYRMNDKEYRLVIKKQAGNAFEFLLNGSSYSATVRTCDQNHISAIINGVHKNHPVVTDDAGNHYIQHLQFVFKISRDDELIKKDVYQINHDLSDNKNAYAPMPGKVIKINMKVGDQVKKGDELLVVEAMKMENSVQAGIDGQIDAIHVKEGEMVDPDTILIQIKQ